MEEQQTRRPRRKFSDEFKRDAVEIVRSSDRSIAEVARELGIYDSSLGSWVRQDQINRGEREGVSSNDKDRLLELERENARLRMERELLKRAVAFWVKEAVRHEALMKRAVMKGRRGLVVVAAGRS